MDTKILVGMAILVIFVVIIGILMMKNKDSYTDPIAPSATDPTSVFTPAAMAYLFSSDGVFSPAGNTWIKSTDGINWLKWASGETTIGGINSSWFATPQGYSAITKMDLSGYGQNVRVLINLKDMNNLLHPDA